jgi:periplasmic protein CpxP/Spy
MKKVIIGIIAIAVLATGAIFVIAQRSANRMQGGGFGGPGGHRMAGMMLRGLDLTDEQKAKVKEIRETAQANIRPLIEQLHENHKKLASLGFDGTFDQAKVEALAAEQARVMSKLIVEKERTKAQVFAILSDEQKAKAAEMQTKHQDRIKDHKGFGPGKGGPMEF